MGVSEKDMINKMMHLQLTIQAVDPSIDLRKLFLKPETEIAETFIKKRDEGDEQLQILFEQGMHVGADGVKKLVNDNIKELEKIYLHQQPELISQIQKLSQLYKKKDQHSITEAVYAINSLEKTLKKVHQPKQIESWFRDLLSHISHHVQIKQDRKVFTNKFSSILNTGGGEGRAHPKSPESKSESVDPKSKATQKSLAEQAKEALLKRPKK